VIVLEMADHGLDNGAAVHLTADGFGGLRGLTEIQTLKQCGWLWPRPVITVNAVHGDDC